MPERSRPPLARARERLRAAGVQDGLALHRDTVAGLVGDPAAATIARSLAELVSTMDAELAASGVRTHAQRTVLRALGCRRAHGPLFGAPTGAAEIERRLLQPALGLSAVA